MVSSSVAQITITGSVTDQSTGAPLPYTTITAEGNFFSITDLDGHFELITPETTTAITFSHPGFNEKRIPVSGNTSLHILLTRRSSSTLTPYKNNQESQLAADLIKRAIAAKVSNDPKNRLESYSYQSYQKSLITANPDSIRGLVDSVFKKKKGALTLRVIDSGAYRLKQRMRNSHLYINETAIQTDYQKNKGQKETILGYQMAGLKKNKYRVLTSQLQPFSFYHETFRLERATFKSPLANTALKTYHYSILDTVVLDGRPGYLVHYSTKGNKPEERMQGVLHLDTTTLALQRGIAQIRGDLEIKAEQQFNYYEEKDLWFPIRVEMEIRKGKDSRRVSLFDDVLFEVEKTSNSPRCIHTNPESTDKKVRFTTSLQNYDIRLNAPVHIDTRSKDISVVPLSDLRSDQFWTDRRSTPLTHRERITYLELDSISGARKINKRIAFLNKLFRGYLPTTYFDFDLKYLIKYNNYEAFRTGMGIITNDRFSSRLTLKAYGVFGTRDRDFKYGANAAYKLHPYGNTHIGINYTDDLTETGSTTFLTEGRTFYVFEPRLFNITSFHRDKSASTYISHDINPALQLRAQWSQKDTQPTYPYVYFNDGRAYSRFQTNRITFSGFWAPNNRYLTSDDGNTLLEPGWPQFNLQYTKGFKGIMGSDFEFSKVELRIRQDIHTFAAGSVSLNLMAGFASGELPITELYHASPNQPTKDALLQRFSVAGYDSFETMYFDEFFSDRYMSLQVKYLLPRIELSHNIKPQVVLISRYAIGNIRNIENHLGVPFQSMSKGYYESGLEFNNIFSGFGLSTLYRYGPYSLPRPEDNLSLKFTFYLSLGI